MRRKLDGLYALTGYLAGLCVFVIFAVMMVTTVMRTFGLPTGGTDDIVSWLTAAAAFYALAHTFKHGDMVRVTLLLESLGPRARHATELVALLVGTAFTGYMAVSVAIAVYDSWAYHDMGTGLIVMPLWIPQTSFLVGSLLLFLAVADELVIVLRGRRPTYVVAVEERHARGDFTEDV